MKCGQVRGRSGFDTAGMKEASSIWHEAAMRFELTELWVDRPKGCFEALSSAREVNSDRSWCGIGT